MVLWTDVPAIRWPASRPRPSRPTPSGALDTMFSAPPFWTIVGQPQILLEIELSEIRVSVFDTDTRSFSRSSLAHPGLDPVLDLLPPDRDARAPQRGSHNTSRQYHLSGSKGPGTSPVVEECDAISAGFLCGFPAVPSAATPERPRAPARHGGRPVSLARDSQLDSPMVSVWQYEKVDQRPSS
jgi:hypothetical protein